jgi:hypothetical protein
VFGTNSVWEVHCSFCVESLGSGVFTGWRGAGVVDIDVTNKLFCFHVGQLSTILPAALSACSNFCHSSSSSSPLGIQFRNSLAARVSASMWAEAFILILIPLS